MEDVKVLEERGKWLEVETFRDFLEWLFEVSGEIDHLTQSEAWEAFEKHNATIDSNP